MKIPSGRLYLSLPYYTLPFFQGLRELPCSIFFVGGIPRDLIIGEKPKDIDIAFCGAIYSLERLILYTYKVENILRTPFLTVNYNLKEGFTINLAHFRKEFYERPAILPSVSPAFSIREDVRRRDFTINSLYLEPHTLMIIDPLGGLFDLKKRVLRVNYKGSFRDDPTRIFRGIRYKTRLDLSYDPRTLMEFEDGIKFIDFLSKERIINELKKLVEEKRRLENIKELSKFGILGISLNNHHVYILNKLDSLLQYSKKLWIFFFAPIMGKKLINWPLTRKEKKILSLYINYEPTENFYYRTFKELSTKEEILALSVIHNDLALQYIARIKNITQTQKIGHLKIRTTIECITKCSYNRNCMEDCLQVL